MLNRDKYQRINYLMLIKVLGWLVMIESGFMLVPTLVSIGYCEPDWPMFVIVTLCTLLCGYLMHVCVRPRSKRLAKRESFLLTGSVWIVFSFFGMLPLMFCVTPYTATDAFTEAMSGLTTTGASVIADIESLGHGVQVWRSMLQWIGGMGIILFTLAIIPMLNHSGGIQMFNAEVTGITHGKLRPRISQTAKSLWLVYISLTVLCILLLWAGPMTLFESVTHSLSTVATGGYSIYNDGVSHYGSNYVKAVTTVFMFLGSVNFALIFAMAHGRFSEIKYDTPLKTMSLAILCAWILISFSRIATIGIGDPVTTLVETLFMSVSSISSTSFTISGFERWGQLAIGVLMLMIFIGGCAGSTSGGVKIDRIIVLFKFIRNEIMRALHPNNVSAVKLGNRTLRYELVDKVLAFLFLDVIIILVGAFVLSVCGLEFSDGFFTTMTSISNSGTCMTLNEYGGSLVGLPDGCKIMLAMIMLTGRLEIYTILVMFTADFWHK